MIKAVLFDYGGVLAEGGRKDSALSIIGNFYGRNLSRGEYERLHIAMRCGELTTREFFKAIRSMYGTDRTMTEDDWNEANASAYILSRPVYTLAASLRAAGIRTGIISNIHGFEAQHIRELGGYDEFDPVVLSCDVHAVKPDPAIYEEALAQLNVAATEVLFVDDQDKCLPQAQALGMLTIQAVVPDQLVGDIVALVRRENDLEL